MHKRFLAVALLLHHALAPGLDAQLNERWLAFESANERLVSEGAISDPAHEVDLAWGDLNGDGAGDLVVVRKEPFMALGPRSNVLLIQEEGRLVDRTAELAASSDVEGDRGFLTATNDRDVVLADLDGDGWLDVATAVDITRGAPKHLSHPRIYRNLGSAEEGGPWRGLAHENARFPALAHLDTGAPITPHFMAIAAGDLDADGDLDLYFGDHDLEPMGEERPGMEEPEADGDDRLLSNDGSGVFSDVSAAVANRALLSSRFCNSVALADINMDERVDIVKQTSYARPSVCLLGLQSAEEDGRFERKDTIYEGRPYFVSLGDLNNDGRPDVVLSDNGLDRHIYNLATREDGGVSWSEPQAFEFASGEDDRYAANNLIADMDGDGWNEVLVADVDPEIEGFDRRTHIYHNRGGTPGGDDIVLREEHELDGEGGWVGAVGLSAQALRGTHDLAVIDLDSDGKQDLVLARNDGFDLWRQVKVP